MKINFVCWLLLRGARFLGEMLCVPLLLIALILLSLPMLVIELYEEYKEGGKP